MTWKQKFLSFEGRMGRQDFWICTLILWAIRWTSVIGVLMFVIASAGLASAVRGHEPADAEALKMAMGMLVPIGIIVIIQLALIWPEFAINVKRFHDRDQPGALVCLFILNWVPLVNYLTIIPLFFFWLINLGILEGTQGPNRYGQSSDPRYLSDTVFA
ncbi:MAG TPA: DUF805 domain-containing protein [Caulobacteraceae bacterium]|nr:DUF805 domain-containing protein [Caulobacteraceae bacterium]